MTALAQAALREAIVNLDLEPGAELDKAAICARLGVSRFPVSEALGRLQVEGLVEILPQRGSRVARISLYETRQSSFIRNALERHTVRAVASQVTNSMLERFDANIDGQNTALQRADIAALHRLDLDFHDMLQDALGFPRVRHAVDAARAGLDRVRRLAASERAPHTIAEHEAIVAALRARDPERAEEAMHIHLTAATDDLERLAARRTELFHDIAASEAVASLPARPGPIRDEAPE